MQLDIHPYSAVADAITAAKNTIDNCAGAARARYITITQGQDTTYAAKYADAIAFKAAGYVPIDGTGFPWVQNEATATNTTAKDTANGMIAMGDLWNKQLGPKIESIRISGKKVLDSMTTVQQVLQSSYATQKLLEDI